MRPYQIVYCSTQRNRSAFDIGTPVASQQVAAKKTLIIQQGSGATGRNGCARHARLARPRARMHDTGSGFQVRRAIRDLESKLGGRKYLFLAVTSSWDHPSD